MSKLTPAPANLTRKNVPTKNGKIDRYIGDKPSLKYWVGEVSTKSRSSIAKRSQFIPASPQVKLSIKTR